MDMTIQKPVQNATQLVQGSERNSYIYIRYVCVYIFFSNILECIIHLHRKKKSLKMQCHPGK